ncbi:hypothetical protein BDQ12DRAFT_641844 [Crucibulum laeve]|uniref:Calcineurin-like phosphoesterase domain-containing protein n=1 Tax=Crucibulum laeve TaxID=68775 RepID=A0A5C3MHF6_9AGAR|nr:hypothetical protein BDQ12DRAFT_641844 [Crucibulum laeve]
MRLRNPLKLKSRRGHALTTCLRLFWVVLAIIYEWGVFYWSLSSCKWPVLDGVSQYYQLPGSRARVLLVADTQVQHPALPVHGSRWTNVLGRFIFDMNLKRNWWVAARMQPNVVIFLGDMLANGRSARTERQFEEAADKFKSMFPVHFSTMVYYIPGNNDIGMGFFTPLSERVRDFYKDAFGPLNQQFRISGHDFIGLDAPGLVDEDYQRHSKMVTFQDWRPLPQGPVSFVKRVAMNESHPVILLTHIPLARPDSAHCGPLREKGTIQRGVGHGFQNTLGRLTTTFLLSTLRPLAIFSGDNRDYCEHYHIPPSPQHILSSTPIREVTVKSFSMSKHIRRPGFQLLSLIDPASTTSPHGRSFADMPCHLPDQHGIYTWIYLPFLTITFFLVFVLNTRRSYQGRGKIEHLSPDDSDLPLWSPTWSPQTPRTPVSPRHGLPVLPRVPYSSTAPTFRAVSRPSTPGSSPFFASIATVERHDDEEYSMYPSQYTVQQDDTGEEQWLPNEEDWHEARSGEQDAPHYFSRRLGSSVDHTGIAPLSSRQWTWSFVLCGRRRWITLKPPTLKSCLELGPFLSLVDPRQRAIVRSTFVDTLSVIWPAMLLWAVIAWWMH